MASPAEQKDRAVRASAMAAREFAARVLAIAGVPVAQQPAVIDRVMSDAGAQAAHRRISEQALTEYLNR